MHSIRVQNLRNLQDTGLIQLKPVTLLLGPNSVGKSTFLRAIPLLKQSILTRTLGPILWDGRYVDYGTFDDAVNRHASEKEITFTFHFDSWMAPKRHPRRLTRMVSAETNATVSLTIARRGDKDHAHVKHCVVDVFDHRGEFFLNEDGGVDTLLINGSDFTRQCDGIHSDQSSSLIPNLYIPDEGESSYGGYFTSKIAIKKSFLLLLKDIIRSHELVMRQTRDTTILEFADNLGFGYVQDMLRQFKVVPGGPPTWRERTALWRRNSRAFIDVANAVAAIGIINVSEALSEHISKCISSSFYVEPLRASAERYYRRQDLAVDEIDSRGKNLPMYLRSLTSTEKQKFQQWCLLNFGFEVSTISPAGGGHVSLVIRYANDVKGTNLADMGFGFSQLIPIIAQLWTLSSGKMASWEDAPIFLCIEQPELHLHPKLQAQLADALLRSISVARDMNIDLRLIVETHSETMVNRIGHRIRRNDFSASDLNVILFNADRSMGGVADIKHSSYNERGILEKWPVGFFDAEAIR